MPTLEVHVLTNDHDWVLPYTLRHYCRFARVVVHNGGPDFTDGSITKALCEAHGAACKKWDTAAELNDALAMTLKNTCWLGTDADWVACVDADELLHFPAGVGYTLETYERTGAAVIKPRGFEMFSETMPGLGVQLTEACPMGAPEEKWYSKPVLFSPKRVADSGLGIGAHESRAVLHDGRVLLAEGKNGYPFADPETFLLHFKAIGSKEQVAERYDATRRRLSKVNIVQKWGNVEDTGAVHCEKKRQIIFDAGLRRVVT